MVRQGGLEPPTCGLEVPSYPLLSRWYIVAYDWPESPYENFYDTPDRTRTCNIQLRRLVLYPVELRGRVSQRLPVPLSSAR